MQRFREGFTAIPPMRELGRQWDRDRKRPRRAARAAAYIIGAELGAHGVDFSFAPVLDLDYGGSSVIGDRALHFDPNAVGALAAAIVQGFADAGMAAVGKHFPGTASRSPTRTTTWRATIARSPRSCARTSRRTARHPGRPRRGDAGARDLPAMRRRAGGLLEVLAAGGAARQARLRRPDLQRRPVDGRRERGRRPAGARARARWPRAATWSCCATTPKGRSSCWIARRPADGEARAAGPDAKKGGRDLRKSVAYREAQETPP